MLMDNYRLSKHPKVNDSIELILTFTCEEHFMEPSVLAYFWAIWLKETQISDVETLKMGQI